MKFSSTLAALTLANAVTATASAQSAVLLHRYDFDTDVRDAVGTANGTLMGGASISSGHLLTNGTSGYVQFATNLIPTQGSFSVAMSFKTTSVSSWSELISQGCYYCPGFAFGRGIYGTWRVMPGTHPGIDGVSYDTLVGSWHHVVVTSNPTTSKMELYIDGALRYTVPQAAQMSTSGTLTRLAREYGICADGSCGDNGYYHAGYIDNVRIYSGVLTAAEIAVLRQESQCAVDPASCGGVMVPGDYATIQAAIDSTPAGGSRTINVAPGTYGGPIDFKGKNVVVRGAGAGATIIAGISGQTSSVIRMAGEPATASLERVTVRDGYTGTPFPNTPSALCGGGIFGNTTAAAIRDCVIEANGAGYGGGIYLLTSSSTIERCTVRNNSATSGGGGIQFYGGRNKVIDTVIDGNVCTSVGAGIALGGVQELTRVTISNNIAQLGSGGIWWTSVGQGPQSPAMLTITDCVVIGNSVRSGQDGGITILSDSVTPWISLSGTRVCSNLPRPNITGRWIDLGGNTVCDCVGDLTADGQVNGADLGSLLSAWGACGVTCPGDLNHDGFVNGADLGLLLSNWGTCAP